ncbi:MULTISPECIES: hypothetical protein [unclassified Marinobacter]|uniref:hypothetical protein n=1 Tax=unclassified Marinobacter TaxID=83889 RepID=UPI001268BDC0|nr:MULTISPECIES: hypothetical protein [unclassified Marinobacter]QFS87614.1 hypothetical protein FIV08_12345 [Marinobacter sp. THAF197a]QFT51399.1 hypothetical protein FIU96_12260 [Marinobacter sp. THAF39]
MTKIFCLEGAAVPQPLAILAAAVEEAINGPVFIAGGVLRDLIHKLPPKDIDLWVYVEEVRQDAAMKALVELFGEPKMEMSTGSTLGNERNIAYIVEFDTPVPVQVIFLSRNMGLDELMEDFDFGLCQVGSNDGNIYATEAFKNDFENKTLTYMRHGETESRIAGRLARLQEKYPEHKPVGIPEVHVI